MMYPRLKLARNLLTSDGVLFISIDDHEIDNLSRLCKEVFGERNFSTTFIRQKKKKPSFLHNNVGSMTEYVVCVTRNREFTFPFSVDMTTAGKKYPLNNAGNSLGILTFPAGSVRFAMADSVVQPQDMSEGKILTRLVNELIIEGGVNKNSFTLEGEWRYSQSRLDEIIEANEKITISKIPFRPNHVKAGGEVKKMHNLLTPDTYNAGTNEDGTEEVIKLLGGDYFDNPKPSSLLRVLAKAVTYDDPDAIVLDFFAGSGTTAQAVMSLNAADGGSRRSIAIQLPEPIEIGTEAHKAGFRTISEISRARIKAAASFLESECAAQLGDRSEPLDTGFRAYRLADTNFSKWRVSSDIDRNQLEQHLFSLRESSSSEDATADDLLTEILLKQSYSLTEQIAPVEVAGLKLNSVGGGLVLAYLNEHVKPTLEQLRTVMDEDPVRLIILEDVFQGDDELKTNLAQLCKSKEVELWTA